MADNRYKFIRGARSSRTREEEADYDEKFVLTDTQEWRIWHKSGNAYQCKRNRSHNCTARLRFDGETYVQIGNHSNHPNDEQEILNREFKNYCKTEARNTPIKYQIIYARACEL